MSFKILLKEINKRECKDDEFLEEFVKAFYLLNFNKTAAIKLRSGEYIAATANYANLVGYETIDRIIDTTDDNLPCNLSKWSKFYAKQDSLVNKYNKTLSFLEIHEFPTGLGIYILNRTPVINPFTHQVVAIEINIEPLQSRYMLETMFSIHKYKVVDEQNRLIFNDNVKLGEKQSEILFCLLIGLKEDKVIADFIRYTKNMDYKIINIKSNIRNLLRKFNVRTRDQLIKSAISYKLHTFIPKSLIKTGSFLLNDTIAVIKS